MLVTLGTNQAISAGASITLPYACNSLQKVFVKVDDASAGSFDHTITVQLGSRTICNGIGARGMYGFQTLQGGHESATNEVQYQVDFGSHQLLDNENLYVTIRAGSALDAVDVSALVNAPEGGEFPVRYTEYSDNVFTAEHVLSALCYKADGSAIDEDGSVVEIRDSLQSSAPAVISANNWFANECQTSAYSESFGLLKKSMTPLTTTFNYPSGATIDSILVASQMGTNARAVKQGRNQARLAQSQVGK